MTNNVFVFDPTEKDKKSAVRGVGRYLQILKENFPQWIYSSNIKHLTSNIFINPFFNFLQPPLTLKRLAKKQIAVIHDLIPLKYPDKFPAGIRGKFNIFLNKLALKNYDLIITDSFSSKKDIVKILNWPENKVKVIYPCLPKSFSNSLSVISSEARNLAELSLGSPQSLDSSSELDFKSKFFQDNIEKNFCLYVGDATWNKNLVNLAKAIKIANVTCVFVGKIFSRYLIFDIRYLKKKSKHPNIQYPISNINLNHPWNKELKEFLKEIEGDQRFIFAGFVDDQTLINLYKQAKCNLLISRDEGFGFSFLEAASQGCPSILSKTPVFQEIAQNNALFVDPNNPNDIADKIIEIYFDKKYRADLGQKAKNHSQNFLPELFKKNFKEII